MGRVGNLFRRALWAPVRVLLPRNPWLRFVVLALPVLLLLAFLEPAFNLVLKLVDLVMRIVQPLLDTTVGRIVLMLLVTGFGALLVATLLRGRVREFRARLCLARHLQAVAALLGDQPRRCREQFRRVARYRGPLPAEYRALVQDARLKLARLCLDAGDTDEALAWLTRVVEPKLPRELSRSLTQLRVRALRAHGAALPETLVADLEAALQAFPDDYPLHRELRDLRHAAGDHAATAALQERVAKMAPAALAARERQQLVADLTQAGEAALGAGDVDTARKCAKKLRATDRDGPAAGLLLGRIQAQAGDLRAAIREWGATRSPEGLDLVAQLLRDHPGAMAGRELLECCPMQGTLLLLAREFARTGEPELAERAARTAAQTLGPSPSVTAVLVEVLQLLGKEQQAQLLGEQAVRALLLPEGQAAAGG